MSGNSKKYRLLTRSDFDGLVCAILLKDMGMLESITFVHPKDVQDGKVEVTENDILTNLPYVPSCHLCFDHHASEEIRTRNSTGPNHILSANADSASRVLYEYFGGHDRFPAIDEQMLREVDRADSARFSKEDILNPKGWVLLSFLMDARTGLGRFREFRVSNYQLMMQLIDYCKEHSIDQILNLPDVRERIDLYREHHDKFVNQIRRCTTIHGNLAVLDLRNEEVIYAGNRFTIYALFPGCNVSMHIIPGLKQQNTVFAIGKSILDRACKTNIGELVLEYGGGGHAAAGTCQINNDLAEQVRKELIQRISAATAKEPALV